MKQSLQGSDWQYRRQLSRVYIHKWGNAGLNPNTDWVQQKIQSWILLCMYVYEAGLLTHAARLSNYTTAELLALLSELHQHLNGSASLLQSEWIKERRLRGRIGVGMRLIQSQCLSVMRQEQKERLIQESLQLRKLCKHCCSFTNTMCTIAHRYGAMHYLCMCAYMNIVWL